MLNKIHYWVVFLKLYSLEYITPQYQNLRTGRWYWTMGLAKRESRLDDVVYHRKTDTHHFLEFYSIQSESNIIRMPNNLNHWRTAHKKDDMNPTNILSP